MAKGDLKSQLGSFVRGALAQLDSVREVVVQKGKAGRIQLDVAMMRRRRRELLAELGEVVARLAANGRITEDDFPEIGPSLAQLEAVEERIAVEEERARRVGNGDAEAAHEAYYEEEYAASPEDAAEEDAEEVGDDEEDLDSSEKRG